jgi:hypothetical protein
MMRMMVSMTSGMLLMFYTADNEDDDYADDYDHVESVMSTTIICRQSRLSW